jgi:hypothetical protein
MNDSRPAGTTEPTPATSNDQRMNFRLFRRRHPGFVVAAVIILVGLLALDVWFVTKRLRYEREIRRLRSGMTEFERRRTDAILASEEHRMRVMLELLRRQAKIDPEIHLAVAADSGQMYLQREGAQLREIPVEMGPEKRVGLPPDTVHMAIPRGARSVARVLGGNDRWEVPAWVYADRGLEPPERRTVRGALGPVAIILDGGTVIYSMPSAGPLNDSTYVLPGSVRARAEDLRAIVPNIERGTTVYFF